MLRHLLCLLAGLFMAALAHAQAEHSLELLREQGRDEIIPRYLLQDPYGRPVSNEDFRGRFQLIAFGYTFCPDVCPMDMARNVEAVDILESKGIEVTPVFISIDPDRDTPEIVGEFAANLHPRAVGLTGSPEQVKAASQAYKTYYRKQDDGDPDFYMVDHSTFTYLMLPGAGFGDFFRREDTAQQMADRVACFVEKS